LRFRTQQRISMMAVCLRTGIFGRNPVTKGTRVLQRLAHTDVIKEYPDFDHYRRSSTLDPTRPTEESEAIRKVSTYSTYAVGGVIALYCAKKVARTIVLYKGPPASMYAMEVASVNLGSIPEGKSSTVLWQGKPVFVKHRTKEEIDRERAVDLKQLRDPQHDDQRIKRPEWLIVIATCTHLGCVPIAGKGNFGGYYCPCHGSHYDGSGRVRQGPAPLNLELPPYYFPDDNSLVIGKEG